METMTTYVHRMDVDLKERRKRRFEEAAPKISPIKSTDAPREKRGSERGKSRWERSETDERGKVREERGKEEATNGKGEGRDGTGTAMHERGGAADERERGRSQRRRAKMEEGKGEDKSARSGNERVELAPHRMGDQQDREERQFPETGTAPTFPPCLLHVILLWFSSNRERANAGSAMEGGAEGEREEVGA